MAATPTSARGGELDLALGRLRIPASDAPGSPCPASGVDPVSGEPLPARAFCGDGDAWARLVTDLAAAAATLPLYRASTGGTRGLELMLELGVTPIDADAPYWRAGTAGQSPADPLARNEGVPGALTTPRLRLRKGLPLGVAVAADLGPMPRSSRWIWGLAVEWAFLEGWGPRGGLVPDVAVRGAVHVVTGEPGVRLVVPEAGVVASRRWAVGGGVWLEPALAVDVQVARARADLVDFTPDVDEVTECVPDPALPGLGCAQPAPPGAPDPAADLRNLGAMPDVTATRARIGASLGAGFGPAQLRVGVSWDALAPRGPGVPDDVARRLTVAVGAGVRY